VARVALSMFRAKWTLPLIPTIAILSLGGGCGGGSEQVTATQLVQRADAACRGERRSFDRIQAHPPPNASVAAAQTGELITATEKANSELRDLEPPDQLRAGYDRYLDARNQVVEEMRRGQAAAEDQEAGAYGAAQAAVARDAPQRRKLARSLGFKVCSSSPATA
jgi:hypothetical protein